MNLKLKRREWWAVFLQSPCYYGFFFWDLKPWNFKWISKEAFALWNDGHLSPYYTICLMPEQNCKHPRMRWIPRRRPLMHTVHASDYIAEAPKQLILISWWSNCNGFREQVCFSTLNSLITPSFAAHHSRRYLDFAFSSKRVATGRRIHNYSEAVFMQINSIRLAMFSFFRYRYLWCF